MIKRSIKILEGKLVILLFFAITAFSPAALSKINSANETRIPIDDLLKRIETEMINGTSPAKLNTEIKKLLIEKNNSSVFYVPEINYLTGRNIEPVPQSMAEKLRRKITNLDILVSATTVIIVMLSTFSLIYASDRFLTSETKRNLSILGGIILIICALIFQGPLFYLIFGLLAGLGLKFREKLPFSISIILLLMIHLTGVTIEKGYFNFVSAQKNLLYIKLQRDNYAPEFLIDRAEKEYIKVASLANRQALLHSVNASTMENLLKKTRDNKIKALILNNLGCLAFQKGELEKAAALFKKSESLYPMTKTYFNLFITYSSLLQPQEAEVYSKKLEDKNVSFDKTAPIIANINDVTFPQPTFNMPTYEIAGLISGIIVALAIIKLKKPSTLISINPFFSYLPGYELYYSNRYSALLLLTGALILIEILIGSMICSMNL
ncbi:hypothetical protein [Desulfurobacterium sp.]